MRDLLLKRGVLALILLLLAVAFFFKISHIFAPYPGIIPDELTYQRQAYLPSLGDVGFGNNLFNLIYSQTQGCGSAWYLCVKSLNLVFDLLFALTVGLAAYLGSRHTRLSVLAGAVVFAMPTNAYSGYFMPEALFAFMVSFGMATLLLLKDRGYWVYLGAIPFGLATFVKPHAYIMLVICFVIISLLTISRRVRSHGGGAAARLLVGIGIILFSRVFLGGLLLGQAGLNPLAGYSSSLSPENFATRNASGFELVPVLLELLPRAVLAFLTNLLPGVLLGTSIVVLALILGKTSLKSLFSNSAIQLSLLLYTSSVLVAASFAALLELRRSEDVVFRLMTRYWEFSLPVFAGITLCVALALRSSEESTKAPLRLLSLFAVLGALLQFIPRSQTQSDSSLLYLGYPALFLSVSAAIIIAVLFARSVDRDLVILGAAVALPLVLYAGAFHQKLFDFASQDKAGSASGHRIIQILESYPDDASRIRFVGDNSAAITASFMSRLETTPLFSPKYYSRVDYDNFDEKPRWVFASKEIFMVGKEPIHTELLGDVVLYEYNYPARIPAYDFERYGIESKGNLLRTFWGAWAEDEFIEIMIPRDYEGDTLVLFLLGNEEYESVRVTVEYGEGESATGQLLPKQAITEVKLISPEKGSWAGQVVRVRAEDNFSPLKEEPKGTYFGISGFSVFYSADD